MPDGTTRRVPPPGERVDLIRRTHQRCGHWGERRTASLLATNFWWRGMVSEARAAVRACATCSNVITSFNSRKPVLQPLPIQGLFYRWGADLFGPLPASARGHTYAMVCVEYFSKHIECIPLPDKTAANTAAAFLQHVLSRFGGMAEVVTDRGGEWEGEFHDLLQQALVDHRLTSPSRPQADGLGERSVSSIKQALRKLCQDTGNFADWDLHLQWVLLGYRSSVQSATGFAPYYLLYGQQPTVPPAIRERMEEPIDFDDPEAAAADVLARAELIKRACVMAGANQRIAQHRDTLRYATVRGGELPAQACEI